PYRGTASPVYPGRPGRPCLVDERGSPQWTRSSNFSTLAARWRANCPACSSRGPPPYRAGRHRRQLPCPCGPGYTQSKPRTPPPTHNRPFREVSRPWRDLCQVVKIAKIWCAEKVEAARWTRGGPPCPHVVPCMGVVSVVVFKDP